MDKTLKRLLSIALALFLVIGLMPWNAVGVYATEEVPAETPAVEEIPEAVEEEAAEEPAAEEPAEEATEAPAQGFDEVAVEEAPVVAAADSHNNDYYTAPSDAVWTSWNGTVTPIRNVEKGKTTYFALNKDATFGAQFSTENVDWSNTHIVICLCGHTLKTPVNNGAPAARFFRLSDGVKVTITDCKGTGKIICQHKVQGSLAGFWNGTYGGCKGFEMYNVIVDGKDGDTQYTNTAGYGTLRINGSTSVPVTIKGCTFQNLTTTSGGAISCTNGALTIEDTTFLNCKAANGNNCGGALYLQDNTSATITNCRFTNCSTKLGGAIYTTATGTVSISGSTFSGCSADDTTTGAGAIYIAKGDVDIEDCDFTKCTAYKAGAIYATGGSDVDITGGCEFTECSAEAGGGAIYMYNAATNLYIDDATFTSCSNTSATNGGGAVGAELGTFTVEDSTFDSCTSASRGGAGWVGNKGTLNIKNCDITDCTANANIGGGFYANGATLDIDDSEFLRCSAKNGGAVYCNGNSKVYIDNTTMTACTATQGAAGAYLWEATATLNNLDIVGAEKLDDDGKPVADAETAAIYVADKADVTIGNGSSVTKMTVKAQGTVVCAAGGKLTINDITLSGNRSTNTTSSTGGLLVSGTVIMNGGTIENNEAPQSNRSQVLISGSSGANFTMTGDAVVTKAAGATYAVYAWNGTANINGGTVNGDVISSAKSYNADGTSKNGDGGFLYITGGVINGKVSRGTNTNGESATVEITGGKISTDVTKLLSGDYVQYPNGLVTNVKCDHVEKTYEKVDNNNHKWTCSNCGQTGTESHDWKAGAKVDSTCTTAGSQAYSCEICKGTKTEVLETVEHSYTVLVESKVATCTEGGYDVYKCATCELTQKQNEVGALDHDMDEGVITTSATCTADGVKTFTCKRGCGHTTTEIVKATGEHSYTVLVESKVATCTEGGYDLYKCATCEQTQKQNEVGELGHDMDEGVITTPATCTADGVKTFTCERGCGHTTTEIVKATGEHSYTVFVESKAATCTEGGYDLYKCATCEQTQKQNEVGELGHDWKAATVDAPKTCKVCGATEGEPLKAVAAIGDKKYETLAEALKVGGEVKLLANVDTDAAFEVNNTVVLNLNGFTVKTTENDKSGDGVFHVVKNGDLTINGEGTINGVGGNNYNIAIWADGGKVTINGGTYTNVGATDANGDTHFDLIYVKNGGEVVINGGEFKAQNPAWTLNSHDTLKGTIVVNGGSFYGFNPYNNAAEGAGTNFVAAGKHASADENGVYTIHTCTIKVLDAVAPNCTETGLTEGKKCTECGETLVAQTTIDALGHKEEVVAGKDATCTETGLTEGKKCSVCDETTVAQTEIPALGHDWKAATVEAPKTCKVCGATEGEPLKAVAAIGDKKYETLAKAIAADGEITLLADIETDAAFVIKTVEVLNLNNFSVKTTENDKSGDGVFHVVKNGDLTINGEGTINGVGGNNYNIAIWADGGKVTINGGTYTNVGATDANGDTHFDLIYVKNGGEVVINGGEFKAENPAWTLNSHDTAKGTIVVNGGSFYGFNPYNNAAEGAGTNFVAAGKHASADENGVYTIHTCTIKVLDAVAPNCTETGLTEGKKCTECGETLVAQTTIDALGHKEETVPGKDATCTETGLTEGKKCSVCGVTTVAQTEIPALKHNFVDGKCSVCDEADPDYVAPAAPVAKIGDETFATLQDAIDAAQAGDKIVLLDNITLTEGVTVNGTVTLDLAGKTITGEPAEAKAFAVITNKGNLTITGEGAIVCDHKLAGSTGYAVNTIVNAGTLTIENGVIENKSTAAFQIGYAIDNNSTSYDAVVVIKGGEVKASGSNYYDGIRLFCNSLTKQNSVTVEGGKVSTIWMQNPSDGAVKNTKDVEGNVTITGGNVGVLSLEPSSAFEASITGGYVGEVSYFQTAEGRDLTGFITGGTFGSNVSAFSAEGYVCEQNTDGTYGVAADPAYGKVAKIGNEYFATLADAVAAIATDGSDTTIKILKDIEVSESVVFNYGTGKVIFEADTPVTIKQTKVGLDFDLSKSSAAPIVIGKNVTFEIYDNAAGMYLYYGPSLELSGSITGGQNWGVLYLFQGEHNVSETGKIGTGRVQIGNTTLDVKGEVDTNYLLVENSTFTADGATVDANVIYDNNNGSQRWGASKFVIKNGSNVNTSKFTLSYAGSELTIDMDSVLTANTITGAGKIVIDAANYTDNSTCPIVGDASTFTGTVEVINNDSLEAKIVDGKIILVESGLKGSGTENDPFLIETVEDLILFRDSVNAGETKYSAPGVYVALGADIDLAGENWVGIGSINAEHGFMGNFNGNGFKIKNLTITDPAIDSDGYAYAGLFSVTEGAEGAENVIKNLIIENVTISTNGHIVAAAIAYPYYTTVENVTVCGDINITGGDYTSGALAYTRRCVNASNVTVSGNAGSTITGNNTVGGVISDIQMNGGLTANYSNFKAENLTIKGNMHVGGISGIISQQTLNGATVKNVELVSSDARVGVVSGSLGDTSTITGVVIENVTGAADVIGATYKEAAEVVAKIGDTYYATLQAAIDATQEGDIVLLAPIVVNAGETMVLDLKGKTVTGTDEGTASYGLITNKGNLTITGNGKITLSATNNRGWNAYSSVISNQPGGKLIVESGVIEHLGGTDMAYGIDNLTNGKGTYAETVINGGTVKSTYRAIRMFLNGIEAQNILTVNGGTIEGANKSIWMQDPSKNANTGTLTVGENATLNGDVYLFVTAGSTEWPVEVSIAAAAVKGEVLTGNVPEGYIVKKVDGIWSVKEANYVAQVGETKYESVLDALSAAIEAGASEIKILTDVREVMTSDFELVINADLTITADAPVKVEFYNEGTTRDFVVGSTNNNKLTIAENVHFDLTDRVIWLGYYGNNVDVIVDGYLGGYQIWHGADTTVSATGTLDSHGEAFVMRRDATLTVDGGKVNANYFSIYSGHINATNADIDAGLVWISNNHSYGKEGTVSFKLDNTDFDVNGVVTAYAGEGKQVEIELVNGTNVTAKGTLTTDANAVITADATSDFTAAGKSIFVAEANGIKYSNLQAAINAGGEVKLLTDVVLTEGVTVNGTVTLDLNGKTITGIDNATGSFGLITNKGNLTVKDSVGGGKITLTATNNRGWNAYSSVISNQPGGKLTVESGVIEHLGGTDMAYGIDNLTNGKGTYAETVINGGTIKSTYRAIRMFLNGIEAQNILTVNGGTIEGANKSIWMQDPSKNANTGTLTVGENATLNGDVYLFVTAGSTEWPVEVSIAAAAVNGEVLTGNVPEGYFLKKVDGNWTVKNGLAGEGTEANPYLIETVEELILFRNSVNAGETKYSAPGVYVALGADIDLAGENWVGIGSATAEHGFMGNFDGKEYKIKNLTITDPALDSDGYAYAGLFAVTEGSEGAENVIKNLTIENVTISTNGHIVAAAIAYPYYTTVENVTVCGDINITGGDYTSGALAYTRRCVNASNVTVSGNAGSTITGRNTVGGVISDIQMNGGLTANYSNFKAENLTIKGNMHVGGISGIISKQTLNGATVKNVELVSSDARVGVVSGSLGDTSTITGVVIENVTGAVDVIGATYKDAADVVAKIGDTYYATLQAAIDATQEGDIVLLVPYVVKAGENVTLDLKGKTISGTHGAEYAMIHVQNGATLTINDSVGGGKITCAAGGNNIGANIWVEGALVQNGGTIEVTGAWTLGFAVDLRPNAWGTAHTAPASFVMNGGEIKSSDTAVRVASNSSDAYAEMGVNFTMNGGTISSTWDAIFVQHLYAGDLNIDIVDGTVSGANSVMRIYGDAGSDIAMNVKGGEFNGAIKVADAYANAKAIAITGGTYDQDPTAYVADGYKAVLNAESRYEIAKKPALFDIQSSSIVLGNELAMYFFVNKADLNGEDYIAYVTKTYADGRNDVTVEIPFGKWESRDDGRMRFKFDGIAAKEMGDDISVVIKNAEGTVLSNTYVDSIQKYVERGLDSGKATGELATMLVDMLNYGAAAQGIFTYDVEHPANANIGAYQDLATQSVALNNNQEKGNGFKSMSLVLESNISMIMFFDKAVVDQSMTAVVTFTDHYGKGHTIEVAGSNFENRGSKGWAIVINELVVADGCQLVKCEFKDANGNMIEGIYGIDSMESMCARAVAGGGGSWYEDIMKFSTAAYNYFH